MGRTEVGTTANALWSARIQEVWSGPRRRAGESAWRVAADLDLEHAVREDARLDEINSASWTGRTWADLRDDPLWPSSRRTVVILRYRRIRTPELRRSCPALLRRALGCAAN